MNRNELRAERVKKRRSIGYMAKLIGKSYSSWQKKENGDVEFTSDEIALIANDLELTPSKVNLIFFDSKLPFGKTIRKSSS